MTLINLYTRVYSDVRWPAPLPSILHRGEASAMYRLVQAEQAQQQLQLFAC